MTCWKSKRDQISTTLTFYEEIDKKRDRVDEKDAGGNVCRYIAKYYQAYTWHGWRNIFGRSAYLLYSVKYSTLLSDTDVLDLQTKSSFWRRCSYVLYSMYIFIQYLHIILKLWKVFLIYLTACLSKIFLFMCMSWRIGYFRPL